MKRRGEEWKKTRAAHLIVYPECRVCGATAKVVVHHLRYRGRVGIGERPGDLVTLCEDHHNELHQRLGRTPPFDAQLRFIENRALSRTFLAAE